jgi:hypothetical protein
MFFIFSSSSYNHNKYNQSFTPKTVQALHDLTGAPTRTIYTWTENLSEQEICDNDERLWILLCRKGEN